MERGTDLLQGLARRRGGAGNLEEEAIITHLRAILERFGENRFTRWDAIAGKTDEHAPRTTDRLGLCRTIEHGVGDALFTTTDYYVLSAVWASEVWKGYNVANVNKVLQARGILTPSSDGKAARSERLPGMGNTRCNLVRAAALNADSPANRLADVA